MAWRYNLPKCPVSPADRGEFMKPTQKSAPALQAPHNSGERVQNGDTALAGADTPSSVSTPAQDETALADRLERDWGYRLQPHERDAIIIALRATSQTPDARLMPMSDILRELNAEIKALRSTPSSASAGPQAEATREAIAEIIQPHSGSWHQRGTRSYFVPNCSDEARWTDALIKADAILALYAHPQPQPSGPQAEAVREPGYPYELHPDTANLVHCFAIALAHKLHDAEVKYGRSTGWRDDDWEIECRIDLTRHVAKGDPLDVAAYAAFCWVRGWSTAHPQLQQVDGSGAQPALLGLLTEVDPGLAEVLRENGGYVQAIRRNVIEECAKAAQSAQLPEHYRWGHDATENFDFGKIRAAAAIRALQQSPATDNAPAVGAHQRQDGAK